VIRHAAVRLNESQNRIFEEKSTGFMEHHIELKDIPDELWEWLTSEAKRTNCTIEQTIVYIIETRMFFEQAKGTHAIHARTDRSARS